MNSTTSSKKMEWLRQFTASGERLEEACKLYKELGFEVKLEKGETDCRECEDEELKTIWIRKKK